MKKIIIKIKGFEVSFNISRQNGDSIFGDIRPDVSADEKIISVISDLKNEGYFEE